MLPERGVQTYEIKFIFPKVKKNLNSSHYCFVTKREGVKKLNRKSLQFACNLSIYLTYFVIQKRDFLSLSGDSNGGWWVLGIKELKFNYLILEKFHIFKAFPN